MPSFYPTPPRASNLATPITCDGLTRRQRLRHEESLAMLTDRAAMAALATCGGVRGPFDGLAFIDEPAAPYVFGSYVEGRFGVSAGGFDQIGGAS